MENYNEENCSFDCTHADEYGYCDVEESKFCVAEACDHYRACGSCIHGKEKNKIICIYGGNR